MVNMTLGHRIRMVRDTAGLTRENFAEKLEVTPATIGRYEKEERIPDANFLHRLVTIFNCDPAWLLVGGWPRNKEDELKKTCPVIDEELLEVVIEVVEDLLPSLGNSATAKQKTQLIIALYDLAREREDRSVDRPTALRLIKLMAA